MKTLRAVRKMFRLDWGDPEMLMAVTMLVFVLVAAFKFMLG